MFSFIWKSNTYPTAWCNSIVVPVLKSGKDRKLPENYRPVSLTSCISKLLERMVNRRLVWILESRQLITNLQCGFRRQRSTIDHIVRLEAAIQDAFVRKHHLLAVFFDLEKAYDTIWRYGILRSLHRWGIRGHLWHFIEEFLRVRNFQVR